MSMRIERNRLVKPWWCGSGEHILGMVMQTSSGGKQLMLYRNALTEAAALEDAEVIAVIDGYAIDCTCSICNRPRTWVIDEATLRRLVRRA